jgi:hypothetical protein
MKSDKKMELVAIEGAKVIRLTQVYRPSGQSYLPEAAAKLIERYSFAKYPKLAEDLIKDAVVFGMGKFRDIGINELSLYPDGMIVNSRCNSSILIEFTNDLLAWSSEELGVVELDITPKKIFFENSIVVRAKWDLLKVLTPLQVTAAALRKRLEPLDYEGISEPFGIVLESDPMKVPRYRPSRFTLERRIGIPFEDNIFFSAAPLPTDDHLDLLDELESLLRS